MVKLEDYTIGELKKMISSFNKLVKFAGHSKFNKAKLINMIRTHPKIKVEEGANAVKLSIKTDETFLKKSLDQKKKETKEKVKKEVKKEVEKLDDVEVVVKSEPLTVTKADGTIKVLRMKPKKKVADQKEPEKTKEPEPKKKEEELIDNWGKDSNNIYLEQNYKNMTEGIRKLINKKGSLNIDGLFQFLKKDSIINKLFMKYSIQKVLDGFKNYVEYLDDEGNKEIGQDNLNDYFSYDQDGRIKSNFRGKDLNSNVLDKMKDTWTKTNKPEKKKEEPEKDKLLNKLVATARSHAKNGISVEGLKDFFNKVQEYKKTNPAKLQSQLAGVLYNFLNKNIQMGKKKLPNNMNNALKELGYKEIKK